MYHTLHDQYRHLGLPLDLLDPTLEFSIFNLRDLRQPLPFSAPVERLNFFVLGFVKQAQGWYLIDEQRFALRPGTIYFTNPGHYRAFEYQELGEAYLVTLSEAFLKENVHPDVFTEFPFLLAETMPANTVTPAVFAEFEAIYQQLARTYQGRSPLRARLLGQLLGVLLLKFKEHFWLGYNPLYEGNRSSAIVRHFRRTLEQHYRDLSTGAASVAYQVQDYAAAQHLHPNYLAQVIRRKTGKTVGTWIVEKAVAEAKAYLQHTELAIKEIAYRLGFTDPAHFSNYFKKHTGLTPQQYRQLPPAA